MTSRAIAREPTCHPSITTDSYILLTVDAPSAAVSLPALRIDDRGTGFATVATVGLTPAPSDILFNYLVVTDPSCVRACRSHIPADANKVSLSHSGVSKAAAVLVTVDATPFTSAVALPGVQVGERNAGLFTVTTADLSARGFVVPFHYAVFEPPARWEEHGPTTRSGDVWTIAVHPTDRLVQYVGSSFGGVWKTTNGGESWTSAWAGQPQALIQRLAMRPGFPNTLVALSLDGTVWQTTDGANAWSQLTPRAPVSNVYSGGALAVRGDGTPFVCSDGGLYYLSAGAWQLFQPPAALAGLSGTYKCSDIVIAADGTSYAAFRDVGLWRLGPATSNNWQKLKDPALFCTADPRICVFTRNRPVRIAIGPNSIVVNDDCEVFVNEFSDLNGSNPTGTWTQRRRDGSNKVCDDAQGGYALSVAISPISDSHFVVAGNNGYVTRDGGATWVQQSSGVDKHQTIFWNAQTLYQATDTGPWSSTDGGSSWTQSETNARFVQGPPVTEYYSLTVSTPDQFGRPLVGGNSQDNGNVYIGGRTNGFYCCGGEFGLSTIAPRPTNILATASGRRYSRFRVYSTAGGAPKTLTVSDITLPGPDYRVPARYADGTPTPDEYHWPLPTEHVGSGVPTDQNNIATASAQAFTSDNSSAIAVSQGAVDTTLVGNAAGLVYRAVPGSDGKQYEAIIQTITPPTPVTAIYFASDSVAFVGYNNGVVYRIANPFGGAPTISALNLPTSRFVTAFANRYGDLSEVYAASDKNIYRLKADGNGWDDITGSALTANLNSGVDIVGLVRDPNHAFLYLATGHRRLRNAAGADWYSRYNAGDDPTVWRSATPAASTSWTRFDAGLPKGLPISGIGLSPSRALYIGTQGRGSWWRRDVTALLPNSGVNSPDRGLSVAGIPQRFVTTCTYPGGWRAIHRLDFKLALGFGPAAGEPFALHVQFDENANLIRFFDPDTGVASEGPPGAAQVLSSRFAQLRLAGTSVRGIGDANPKDTVEIVWDVTSLAPAAGDLQQYLQVTDDAGASTGFDKVGTWQVQVGSQTHLAVVSNGVAG